jgi:RecA/RadA recombinase
LSARLPSQRAAHPQAPHEDGQHRGGGERRDAEDQSELAQPDGLVDQRAEAGAEQQRDASAPSASPALRPIAPLGRHSTALDLALGIGGLPRGRIVEIFGPESSGKTTLASARIAEAQRRRHRAFIDAEHALDPAVRQEDRRRHRRAARLPARHGEQALEIADMLVRSGAVDVIVIDSVAALVPRAEIEGEMGDSHVGLQAR